MSILALLTMKGAGFLNVSKTLISNMTKQAEDMNTIKQLAKV